MSKLTIEQIETAIAAVKELPKSNYNRVELLRDLPNTLKLVERGIEIKDTATVWIKTQNTIRLGFSSSEFDEV